MKWFAPAFAAFLLAAATASPALSDPYTIDAGHTHVGFKVSHLGFSDTYGTFNNVAGTFDLDQDNPEKSSVDIDIKTASIDTNHEKRDEHLRGPDFFDVGKYPDITFKSTKVERTGDKTAKVTGNLTMLGVTKPVTLDVTLLAAGPYPMDKSVTAAGFNATATIKRSDFGMTAYVPMISDEVDITISTEVRKQ
ncbi:MAG: YceI family protein [Nitratireductor sp.]